MSVGLAAVLVAAALAAAVAPASAADAKAGRAKAAGTCQACHGMDGLSKNPESPNIAGQVESYLVRSLQAYRSGERRNDAMTIVTKDLSDADIADLSAYYGSIQVDVIPPS